MSTPLLEARDVSVEFRLSRGFLRGHRTLHAVRDASLALHRGEVLGIVGESGSGKSTLALVLLGLLRPTHGTVWLAGASLASLGRARLAQRLQPVFQNPYAALNPARRIGPAIRQPLDVHRIGTRADREAAVRVAMERVGLPPTLAQARPAELSGGQRQRVAIARAIIMQPDLLICDEPTSALDVSVQAQILNLLQDLRDQAGLGYVLISHNLAVVEHAASRVAVMYLGHVVEIAPARAFFAQPRHPYSRALQDAILTLDPDAELPDAAAEAQEVVGATGCPFAPRCPGVMPVCRSEMPRRRMVGLHEVRCHLYPDS